MFEVLIFWVGFSLAVGMFASGRGRSFFGWFLLSLLISPLLAFLFAAVSSNIKQQQQDMAAQRGMNEALANSKKCPQCAELVKKEAKICRFCGYEFGEVDVVAAPQIVKTYKGLKIAKLEGEQFEVQDADGNRVHGSNVYSSEDDALAFIEFIGETGTKSVSPSGLSQNIETVSASSSSQGDSRTGSGVPKIVTLTVIGLMAVGGFLAARDLGVQNPQPSKQAPQPSKQAPQPSKFEGENDRHLEQSYYKSPASECGDDFGMNEASVVDNGVAVFPTRPEPQLERIVSSKSYYELYDEEIVVVFCTRGEWSFVGMVNKTGKPNGWVLSKFLKAVPDRTPDYSGTNTPVVANPEDMLRARKFLSDLPPACANSSMYTTLDGTVVVGLECRGSSDAMSGEIRIKDGVVTQIR